MKYVKQLGIIIFISLLGEIIHYYVSLPIPASIYGIILFFIGLETHIIPLHSIKETSSFLLEILPLLFVPAGVGLLDKWDILQPLLLPFAVVVVATTFLVMIVTGRVTQWIISRTEKGDSGNE